MFTIGFILEFIFLFFICSIFIYYSSYFDRPNLYKIFFISLFVKLILFIFINNYLHTHTDGFSFYDDYDYHHVSSEMAAHWKQGEFYHPKEIKYQAEKNPGYYYVSAFIYSLFGSNTYNVRLLNLFLSIIIAFYVYLIGSKIFSNRIGLVGAFIFALLPDIIFWSSLQFKDFIVTFLVMGIIFNLFYSENKKRNLIISLISIILLSFIRIESSILILITYFISKFSFYNFFNNYKKTFSFILALFALFIFVFLRQDIFLTNLIIGFNTKINLFDFKQLLNHSPNFSTDGLLSYGYIFSILQLWKLPFTFFIILFTPFPPSFDNSNIAVNMLSIFSIPWLLLVPLILYSNYKIISDKILRNKVRPILIYVTLYLLMLSLFLFTFSPIRHRIEILPFLILFCSYFISSPNKFMNWLVIGFCNFFVLGLMYTLFKM